MNADTRRRLFLVEDDLDVLASLTFRFEADGYEVVALTSAEALLSQHPPDRNSCVVIDQRLPGITGLEALARLREGGVAVPAILVTTHPSTIMVRRAAELDAAIVEKPLLGDVLSHRVADLMAR